MRAQSTAGCGEMTASIVTVAGYLLTRLKEIGVDHLFGVPGDFVLGFFNQVQQPVYISIPSDVVMMECGRPDTFRFPVPAPGDPDALRESIIIAETGVALFSAAEMLLPEGATFIGQTFYGSIGYTVGATLGAGIAAPDRRLLLFIGDGAFQVTCQDLSTIIRNGLKPVVFLINNDGYTIERVISDHPYNDIQPWRYHRLTEVFGGGQGLDVHTEGELEAALAVAASADALAFIEIHTGRLDCPESLRSAGLSMAKSNRLD
jgi:TPP-dependent 2-oxoacid decarboxylase